jgi:hypothetical protein
MCLPRPAALTSPIARRAPGIKALTKVDFPTPEWPTKTLRCRAAIHVADPDRYQDGDLHRTPSGSYCAMSSSGDARSALVRQSSGWIPAS